MSKSGHREMAWPISKADIDPFLADASDILEIDFVVPDAPFERGGFKKIDFVYSPPVRFGEKYFEEIAQSSSIFLSLNSNVVSFNTNGSTVTDVTVADFSGQRKTVEASCFVLATGGIENSRLLLWSNVLAGGQLVKNPAPLGKYWMEHPSCVVGDVLADTHLFDQNENSIDRSNRHYFSPTSETIEQNDILNAMMYMYPLDHGGMKDLMYDLACASPNAAEWAAGLLGRNRICGSRLIMSTEQMPIASNRIELLDETDSLGVPRISLHWQKSEFDLRAIRTTATLFGNFLARENLGRVRLDPWVLGEAEFGFDGRIAGHHHMGGTRMAATPVDGVVDRNCKVFGQDNLYIASSSVFPSGGHANPTLTIVQLALRLADHLS